MQFCLTGRELLLLLPLTQFFMTLLNLCIFSERSIPCLRLACVVVSALSHHLFLPPAARLLDIKERQ